ASEEAADEPAPDPADTLGDSAGGAIAALDADELPTPITPQEAITEVGATVDEPMLRESQRDIEHEVEPDQIDDEIHQLSENDYEEVEHTQIGAADPASFDDHAYATTPSLPPEEEHAIAERLDQHLAEVEAEGEHDDLGIGEASGHY